MLSRTAEIAEVNVPARARAVSDSVVDILGREYYLVPSPGV